MKVKKYIAGTMPEAMNLIRKDLGPDAVILNSKEIKHGGFFGLFKKQKIEVFAALDEEPFQSKKYKTIKNEEKQPSHIESNKGSNSNNKVLSELNYLKKLIEQQVGDKDKNYPPSYQIIHDYLLEQEVEESLVEEIIGNTMTFHNENNITPSIEKVLEHAKNELRMKLRDFSFEGITYDKKIVHFVGPTGVGKTTTLAKVAAKSMLEDKKHVAFITTDTYRIAAIEQLKTYAKILDIPVEIAYSNEDYKQAIDKFSGYDLILVDTAGRNFREDKYIKEMKETVQLEENTETYLVLSLTAKPKDLFDIQQQFKQLPIKEIVFTKLDETTQFGSVLSIMKAMNKGVAYITNGQDVPDDLMEPTPERIIDLIIGDFHNE